MSRKRVTYRNQVAEVGSKREKRQYTLRQLFDMFIASKKADGAAQRTLGDYHTHMRYFERWLNESEYVGVQPLEFDVHVFRAYVAYMSEKYKPVTINIRLTTLKTMFAFLAGEGIMPSNPLERIRKVREPEDTIEAFTEEQVSALLAQPDRRTFYGFRDYVMMTLLLDTGMRIGEILKLEESDVDTDYRQVRVAGTTSKTRKTRLIPVTKHTAKLVQELITENRQHFDIDLVFLSSDGNPLSYESAYSRIKKYGEMAGIEEARVSPHTFRHTFAKMFILNGGDPFTLQKILGHTSLDMVRKYIQLNTEDLRIQHGQHSPIVSMLGKRPRIRR